MLALLYTDKLSATINATFLSFPMQYLFRGTQNQDCIILRSQIHDSHSTIQQCIAALLHTIDVCVNA